MAKSNDKQSVRKIDPSVLRTSLETLASDIDNNLIALSRDLFNAKSLEFYIGWGFATWDAYLEACVPSLDKKKETRLRRIWSVLVAQFGVKPSDIASLKYSKSILICRDGLLTKENVESWVRDAKRLTQRELRAAVEAALPKKEKTRVETVVEEYEEVEEGTGTVVKHKTVVTEAADDLQPGFVRRSFVLSEQQAVLVDEALNKASSMSSSPKEGFNIEMICTDYLAGHIGDAKEAKRARLRYHLENLERVFGVRLAALPDTPETEELLSSFATASESLFEEVEEPEEPEEPELFDDVDEDDYEQFEEEEEEEEEEEQFS